jgi:hypothetical protein
MKSTDENKLKGLKNQLNFHTLMGNKGMMSILVDKIEKLENSINK